MALEKLTVILHGVDELSGVASGAMDQLVKFGAMVSGIVTASVVGLGAAALNAGLTMDEALDNIVIKSGKTGAELEGLQESFRQVFADIPVDANTTSDAIALLGQRTQLSDKPLQNLAKDLLNLSRITNTNVVSSGNKLLDVLGNWNRDFEEGSEILNQFFFASQDSGAGVEELMNQVLSAGPILRQMGFSLEESIGLMESLNKTGVDSAQVMVGLRGAAAKFAEQGIAVREGLEGAFSAIKNTADETEALRIATELFGTRAGPAMVDAIRSGKLSLTDLVDTLDDARASISDTAQATDDYSQKWQVLMNRVTLALEPAGAAIMDLAGSVLDALMPAFEKILPQISTFLSNLSGVVKTLLTGGVRSKEFRAAMIQLLGPELGGKLTNFAGAIDEVVQNFAAFITEQVIPFVERNAPALEGALKGIALALLGVAAAQIITAGATGILAVAVGALTNPITWLLLAAAALGAAWETNFLGIRTTVESVWNQHVRPALINARDFFVNEMVPALQNFGNRVGEVWKDIKIAIDNAVAFIRPVIEGWIKGVENWFSIHWPAIRETVEGAWGSIRSAVEGAIDFLRPIVEAWISGVSQFFNVHFPIIRSVVETTWARIQSVISTTVAYIRDFIIPIFTQIGAVISLVWNLILGITSFVWNRIKSIVESVANYISTAVNNIRLAYDLIRNMDWAAVGRQAVQRLGQVASGIWGAINTNIWGTLHQGLANVVIGVRNFLGIHSPSELMAEMIGEPMAAGIAAGMRRALGATTADDLGLETLVGAGRTVVAAGAGDVTGFSGKTGVRPTVVFQYAPFLSTASQEEAEFAIRPMIEQILRDNGVIT